jgi:hypothetical protein
MRWKILAVLLFLPPLGSACSISPFSARPVTGPSDCTAADAAAAAARKDGILAAQSDIVAQELARLLPERPGITDLYFIGFGGDASQDVFMNEVLYAITLFDQRFDTKGRSIALINNRKTLANLPLASCANLGLTLRHIGRVMNPQEDIVFLFLTSHGSKDHRLQVTYEPLPFHPVSASDIARLLEESGIQWSVVVVSACYSGGFIDTLKNGHTLVMTAAAANRPSFGCADDADLTYFGKALFIDQLNQEIELVEAFAGARAAITKREEAENLPASQPQLYAPPAMVEKLKTLEERLRQAQP